MACEFIKEPPEVAPADGNVYIEFVGSGLPPICMSERTFKLTMRRGNRVLDELAEQRGRVVPIKGQRGRSS